MTAAATYIPTGTKSLDPSVLKPVTRNDPVGSMTSIELGTSKMNSSTTVTDSMKSMELQKNPTISTTQSSMEKISAVTCGATSGLNEPLGFKNTMDVKKCGTLSSSNSCTRLISAPTPVNKSVSVQKTLTTPSTTAGSTSLVEKKCTVTNCNLKEVSSVNPSLASILQEIKMPDMACSKKERHHLNQVLVISYKRFRESRNK